MKVVKLNRRFKQYKENGHTVAFKFPHGYTEDAREIERVCKARLSGYGWLPQHDWYHYYGERNGRNTVRPYWITFRNEADATLVLLSASLTQNG
jgi:hypothetical protein